MKKEMKLIFDKKQVGVRIPKEMVKELNLQKGDKIEWVLDGKTLRGYLRQK